jgi:uncharacterized protein (TIGR02246 family)
VEDVLPVIEEANIELEAAYLEGDPVRLAALFTEDALIMPNGGQTIPGRAAMENLFERIFSVNTVVRYQLVAEELEVFGNTLYERGIYDYQAIGARQDTTADQGRYIMLRQRSSDGSWLIHRWLENVSPASHPAMQR